MIRLHVVFFLIPFLLPVGGIAGSNQLPKEVVQALHSYEKAVLFSLEPGDEPNADDPTLYRFKVLGQTGLNEKKSAEAVKEFESAVSQWDGMIAMCFNPRHALQVTSRGHVYNLLLCYECNQLYTYKDNKLICSVGATGSPEVLNALLTEAKIPLAHTDSKEEIAARIKKAEESDKRWLEGMPKSVRPLWNESFGHHFNPDLKPFRLALAREFPEIQPRILALFKWYGSGDGPWSGYPISEDIAQKLLLDFSTPELIAAAQTPLNPRQLEGAARLLGGWDFSNKRPNDLKTVPENLKEKLLKHSLQSPIEDVRERAQNAFGEP